MRVENVVDTDNTDTAQGRWVASMDGSIRFEGSGDPSHLVGPFRVAACLNACDGISTEALEEGVVEEMLRALMEVVYAYENGGMIEPILAAQAALAKAIPARADLL